LRAGEGFKHDAHPMAVVVGDWGVEGALGFSFLVLGFASRLPPSPFHCPTEEI
jgi:hypothetical protein